MSLPYEEVFDGAITLRRAPGTRHELICSRLHDVVKASTANLASTRLLSPRTRIQVATTTTLCSDLALVTMATGKLCRRRNCGSDDHRADTVVKKQI
jgi:hypothetical protein